MKKHLDDIEKQRYARQLALPAFSEADQLKLANSKVVIIGCGGLGVPCAMQLAAIGVGNLTLVDFDTVEISNMHRQAIYTMEDVARSKAFALTEKITLQNPHIRVTPITEVFSEKNALSLVNHADLVLDCTDQLLVRYLINDACVQADVPFISAGIYRFEGQIGLYNFQGSATYRCAFPEQTTSSQAASCDDNGVLGTWPAVLGSMQAMEAVKTILNLGELLENKVLFINGLNNVTYMINSEVSDQEIGRARQRQLNGGHSPEIQLSDLILDRETVLIDVREHHEWPEINHASVMSFPLSGWQSRLPEFPKAKRLIFFCAKGIRSAQVVEMLRNQGMSHAYTLVEGAESLLISGKLEQTKLHT